MMNIRQGLINDKQIIKHYLLLALSKTDLKIDSDVKSEIGMLFDGVIEELTRLETRINDLQTQINGLKCEDCKKLTPELVETLNMELHEETILDDLLTKYGLKILPEFEYKQVVGIEGNTFLIYDEESWYNYEDGFSLMIEKEYIKEAQDCLERRYDFKFENHILTIKELKEVFASLHDDDRDEPDTY